MRKRVLSFILVVSALLVLTPDTVMAARMDEKPAAIQETAEQTADEGTADSSSEMQGIGTETAPYRIKNAEQFRAFADMVNGVNGAPDTGLCAVLTCNIDLSDVCGADIGSWTPIGTNANPYTGIFDGGSFAITGLYYHKSNSSYVGLFGCNAGTVKNLGVAGADIAAGSYTGGVCGYNSGIITGCYNTSSVNGTDYTGGVCGYNNVSGTVSVCYNMGAVSGRKYVGGICGYNRNTTINCYNMGSVYGKRTSIGGICGYNRVLVSNCFNTGTVNGGGKNYIGSICGYNHSRSSFLNCYYLITGEEKGNYGLGMTQEQFASGEVCWLLNDGKGENVVWHQTCGAGFPAFGGKVVYQVQRPKTGGSADEMIVAYTNEKEKKQAVNTSDNTSDENTNGHVYQEPEWTWQEYKAAKAVFICRDCGEKLSLEAAISGKTTKATCGKEGKTVYTASVDRDGEIYTDEKTVKLEKPEHPSLVLSAVKDATCTESGIKRECWQCPECGEYFDSPERTKVLSKKEVVEPAKGHKYSDPSDSDWKWADNYTTATVTFTCTVCQQKVDQTGKVTSKTKATCKEQGDIVYTAVVKFNGKTYKKDITVIGQPIPHSYGKAKWKWADDFSTATATVTCTKCRESVTQQDNNPKQEIITASTCKATGKKKHTAVVNIDGMEYTDVKTETLDKLPHSYSKLPKEWNWSTDFSKATATFTCDNCGTPVTKTAVVTKVETTGTDCGKPGTITYTAVVTLDDGTTCEDKKEKELPAKHTLNFVDVKEPTCVEDGYKKHWECTGGCSGLFSDSTGKTKIDKASLIIPAKGHSLKHVEGDIYECTACNKRFIVKLSSDGTTSMYSVDEDAVIPQNETENPEETQENPESQSADEQDEVMSQDEPEGQDGEIDQGETEDQSEQNMPSVQNGESEQNEDENSGFIPDMPENAARYGLIYPEGEGEKDDPVTADAWEESAINLRVTSAGKTAPQTIKEQQQQGYRLWVSVAVLFALAGVVLVLLCKRKVVDDKR